MAWLSSGIALFTLILATAGGFALGAAPPTPPHDGLIARLGTTRFHHTGIAKALAFTPDGKSLIAYTQTGIYVWDAATGKERRHLFSRTSDTAYGMAISPDGATLAVAVSPPWDAEVKIELWDLARATKKRTLSLPGTDGRFAPGSGLAISSDGKSLAFCAGHGGKAYVFDLASGKVRAMLGTANWRCNKCAFIGGGKTLATASWPMEATKTPSPPLVEVWDIATGKRIQAITNLPTLDVAGLCFSRDGNKLAVGDSGQILVMRTLTGERLPRIDTHMSQVFGLVFTPDGNSILARSGPGPCKIWDAQTGKLLQTINRRARCIRACAVSSDGKTIALATSGAPIGSMSSVQLWDTATGAERITRDQRHTAPVNSLAFSPDGAMLISAGDDEILLWNIADWRRSGTLASYGHALIFSQDGKKLALLEGPGGHDPLHGGYSQKVPVWDWPTRRLAWTFRPAESGYFEAAGFSSDGTKLMTLEQSFSIIRNGVMEYLKWHVSLSHWNLGNGKENQKLVLQDYVGQAAALLHDGTKVLAVGKALNIYDTVTKRTRLLGSANSARIGAPVPSPDQRMAAFISGEPTPARTVRLVELAGGKETATLYGGNGAVGVLAWSPDSRLLATGDEFATEPYGEPNNQAIRLWDSASGKALAHFDGLSAVTALTFSREGKMLVAGLRDGSILVFDISKTIAEVTRTAKLDEAGMDALWANLAGNDAAKAQRTLGKLVKAPAQVVPFIRSRVKPVAGLDQANIKRLIIKLGSEKFTERQLADRQLRAMGILIAPYLRAALTGTITLETRLRLEQILNKISYEPGGKAVHMIRAITVLERIGTPDAQDILENLARGAQGAFETEEAQASLRRLLVGQVSNLPAKKAR